MKHKIEVLIERLELGFSFHSRDEFNKDLREILMAFADSIATLQDNVNKLEAQGQAAVDAAVAAKDAKDAVAVDAVNATVVAALTPAPPVVPAA